MKDYDSKIGVTDSNQRRKNLKDLRSELEQGLTKDRVEEISGRLVAPGINIESLIEMRLDFGEIGWQKNEEGTLLLIKKTSEGS